MIGILTFHWADDYGAMLQAYALKHYLEKVSKEKVEILPYAAVKLTGRYWLYPLIGTEIDGKIRYTFKYWGFKRNVFYLRKFLRRRKRMRKWRRRHLTTKKNVKSGNQISLKKYSHVFIGSDQVWNPEITVGLDDVYIGNVTKKGNCKLISYGASFGSDTLPEKYRSQFRESVCKNFTSISLREKSAVPFVESFFPGKVTDVLDPTLLLKRAEWEKIGKKPHEQGYILFVYTEQNKQMVQYLYDLSAMLRKKVIQLTMPPLKEKREWIDYQTEGGPSEYIGFFQNADYVVTNSFHGMAFSILLEKQFIVFGHSNKNARIKNLMEKLNLMSRLAEYGEMPEKEKMLEKINWERVRTRLKQERRHSVGFIRNELI